MSRSPRLSAARTVLVLFTVVTFIVTSSLGVHAQPSGPAGTTEIFAILNFANGDTVRYDLPLLKGAAPGSTFVKIESAGEIVAWSVNSAGSWRAFVPLAPGDNEIRLTTSQGSRYRFHLTYTPQANPYALRLVYPMASDSAGTFDAPAGAPNSKEHAQRRLQLTGRILQSLTAELRYEQGRPRRTFRLLTGADGVPVVDTPRSPLSVAQVRSMEGIDLWYHYLDLFDGLANRDKTIDVAVMADSHFDAAAGKPLAHTALGGRPLALFGGATLYSYAETVGEIEPRFLDTSTIEPDLFPEYGRRAEYWAAYTTSIGAILHEVGHTFGLDHPDPSSPGAIMARGFDYLNRAASALEPYHGDVDPAVDLMPQWTAADVAILDSNPWFNSGSMGGGSGGPAPAPVTALASPSTMARLVTAGTGETVIMETHIDLGWPQATWQAVADWGNLSSLEMENETGASGELLRVHLETDGYRAGEYAGSITVTPIGGMAGDVPVTIPVRLTIVDQVQPVYLPLVRH